MTIVTLTTDWKSNDYYVGAIKGKILSKCSDIQVVFGGVNVATPKACAQTTFG